MSIRGRITLATIVAVSAAIAISGCIVHRETARGLERADRESLEAILRMGGFRAAMEADRARRRGDPMLPEFGDEDVDGYEWFVRDAKSGDPIAATIEFPVVEVSVPPEPAGGMGDAEYDRLVDARGTPWLIASVWIPEGGPRPRRDEGPGARRRRPDRPGMRDGPQGGEFGRGRPRPEGPMNGGAILVSAAMSTEAHDRQLSELGRLLLLAGIASSLASGLLIRALVVRGLRPLDHLSREVEAIDPEQLDRTLDVPAPPAELVPIVQSLDASRARLAEAFARERRFTADAAHELRTPIAGLRASLEVALRREREPDEYRRTIDECLGIALSMQSTVESLLALVRNSDELERSDAVEVGAALRETFDARGAVEWTVEGKGEALVHRPTFDIVTANLVSNAVAYSSDGSPIEASVTNGDGRVRVELSNRSDALPVGIESHAFEPFWRADAARTHDRTPSVGLGLALARRAAESLDGSLTIEVEREGDSNRGRFVAVLVLPATGDHSIA